MSCSGVAWPWKRQLPGKSNTWGNTRYTIDSDPDFIPDWLVIYDGWPTGRLLTNLPRTRRILITGEPETFHRYQPRFLDQFGVIITTQRAIRHQHIIYSQCAVNWFAGINFDIPHNTYQPVLQFEDFFAVPPKTKLCSIVCSTKSITLGHRNRLNFIKELQHRLGAQIDVYGRGFCEIADKDEALAPYRFHIALENSTLPDYWTEKLADPFLRGCYPIYSGCTNLSDYFPSESYTQIDISQPHLAIKKIQEVLNSLLDQERASYLAEAKRRILFEYNVFGLLERIYPNLESSLPSENHLITPEYLFSDHEIKSSRFHRRIARFFRTLLK